MPMKYDINKLSLEEKIGQMIIIGLNTEDAVNHLAEMIQKYKIGGILLYKKNYKTYEEMINLINQIKALNRKNKIPICISIDQEGGRVNRMPNEFKNLPVASKLAEKSGKKDMVKIAGEITGSMLHKTGIHMDFAPVLDIKRFKDKQAIGDRAYSENVEEVSKYGIEYMKALQKHDVMSIAKHFPGHGATKEDSHFRLPKIECDIEKLENEDMLPFKKAIENKVDGILVGHLRITKVTGKIPASLSKRFITKYIRKKYRYNGLVITDDMRMKGMRMRYGKNRAIKKAFMACNDIIVFKYDDDIRVIEKIVALVKEHKLEEKRVNKSVRRILALKEKYHVNDEMIKLDKDFIETINDQIEAVRKEVL